MEMTSFTSGPYSTNGYLLVSKGVGALIDCPPDSAPLIEEAAKGIEVEKILLTHSHWDHIADCGELADHFGAAVYVHEEDAENLRHPGADGLKPPLTGAIPGREPDGFLAEGDEVMVGQVGLKVLHTPGHAPGQICLYNEAEGILFCGDLLFRGAMGSIALPTAEPERMWSSLARVAKLPGETVVYSGHGPSTTIGAEGWLARAKELYGF